MYLFRSSGLLIPRNRYTLNGFYASVTRPMEHGVRWGYIDIIEATMTASSAIQRRLLRRLEVTNCH